MQMPGVLSAVAPATAMPVAASRSGLKATAAVASTISAIIATAPKGIEVEDQTTVAAESQVQKVVVCDPFPLRRIPSRVLREEDYTEAVSAIIERDFFPDLAHLRVRREILLAKVLGDEAQVQALEWKLINLPRPTPLGTPAPVVPDATPGPTALTPAASGAGPADFEDGEIPEESQEVEETEETRAAARLSAWERDDGADSDFCGQLEQQPLPNALLRLVNGKDVTIDLSRVRLDDFQRVFTSEDNASFEAIRAKDLEKRRKKEWWIEGTELDYNTKLQKALLAVMDGDNLPDGITIGNAFKGRNALSFVPQGLPQRDIERLKVDFKNTRFTTDEQVASETALQLAIAARRARLEGEKTGEALEKMLKEGKFSLPKSGPFAQIDRAVGGRLESGGLEKNRFGLVETPTMIPGHDLSPLMTYGKIASTPRLLEEAGPTFSMADETPRDRAAEKLQKGVMKRQREVKQLSKSERWRALGLTPTTPLSKSGTPGSGLRLSPGSVMAKVTPMSPIGQLLHRAQRMAQKGGRLRIGTSRSPAVSTPRGATTPRDDSSRPGKRARQDTSSLPASITDDLL